MKQTLIKNVEVWTMDGQDRRFSGWVLFEDGKIAGMGESEPPTCAQVLDGEGGVLTPGLIDIHSHLGLYEDGLGFEGADGNEDTDPVTPHLRVIDGVNPMDRGFQEAVSYTHLPYHCRSPRADAGTGTRPPPVSGLIGFPCHTAMQCPPDGYPGRLRRPF